MNAEQALEPFRVAATLTHLVPALGATISAGGQTLLQVTAGAYARDDEGPPVFSPCQFRVAVTRAHQRVCAGEALSFMGLPDCFTPTVWVEPIGCGKHLAGDLYRVPLGERWCWLVAWPRDPEAACAVAERRVRTWSELPEGDQLRLRVDTCTDVTVAYVETSARSGSPQEMIIVRALEAILASWVVEDLLSSLTTSSPS